MRIFLSKGIILYENLNMSIPKCEKLRIGNFPPLLPPSGGLSFISTMAKLAFGLHGLHIAQSMLLTGVSVTHIDWLRRKSKNCGKV